MNTIRIPNIENFTQQISNGNLILTRIVPPFIDEATLFGKDLRGTTIIQCKINNKNQAKKYNKILIALYQTLNRKTIVQKTTLNISKEQLYEKGFVFYPNLGVSIQGVNARRILGEILNMIKIKNYTFELTIRLKNDEIVHFKYPKV